MTKISELTDDQLKINLKKYKEKKELNSEDDKAEKIYKKIKKEIEKRSSNDKDINESELKLKIELEKPPTKNINPAKKTPSKSNKLTLDSPKQKPIRNVEKNQKADKVIISRLDDEEWGVGRSLSRSLARGIDGILILSTVLSIVIFGLIQTGGGLSLFSFSNISSVYTLSATGIWIVFILIYEPLLLRMFGATIGKLIVGLKIVPNDNAKEKLTWKMICLRYYSFLFLSSFTGFIYYALALFNPKRRQLADIIAGTQVISLKGTEQEVKKRPIVGILLILLSIPSILSTPSNIIKWINLISIKDGKIKFNFEELTLPKSGHLSNAKKYQLKAMSAEAKLNLAALYSAETSYMGDYKTYATCLHFMGVVRSKKANYYFGFPSKNIKVDSNVKGASKACSNDKIHFFSPTGDNNINHSKKFLELVEKVKKIVPNIKIGVSDDGMSFTALAVRELKMPDSKMKIDAWTFDNKRNMRHVINVIKDNK